MQTLLDSSQHRAGPGGRLKTKIAKVVENAGKAMGAPVEIAGFVRFALGEGIEKAATDFAAEVAAAVKTA